MYDNEERFLSFAWALILTRLCLGIVDCLLRAAKWWHATTGGWSSALGHFCGNAGDWLLTGFLWLFTLLSLLSFGFMAYALCAWLVGLCRKQPEDNERG